MNENDTIALIAKELPTLEAMIGLYRGSDDAAVIAKAELTNFRMHTMTNPALFECIPVTIIQAIKLCIMNRLTLAPNAGLVYLRTRNLNVGTKESPRWVKALEAVPTANGMISIARQCGRILDIKRPLIQTNETGKVVSVSVEVLKPSMPAPRWELYDYDESDFERWAAFSHKENSRGKGDVAGKIMANALYTSWRGGIDPELARTKSIRHCLKKLGCNLMELAPMFNHATDTMDTASDIETHPLPMNRAEVPSHHIPATTEAVKALSTNQNDLYDNVKLPEITDL